MGHPSANHGFVLGPRSPFACDRSHKTCVWYRATGGWNSYRGPLDVPLCTQKRNGKTERVWLVTANWLTDGPLTLPSGDRRLTRGLRMTLGLVLKIAFWCRLLRHRRGVPDCGDLHVALYFSVWCRCPRDVRGVRGHISIDCLFVVTTGVLAQRLIQMEGCCAIGAEATAFRALRIVRRTSDLGTVHWDTMTA